MRRQYSIRVKLPALIALACLVFGLLSWIIIVSQTTKPQIRQSKIKAVLPSNNWLKVSAPLFLAMILSESSSL